MPYTVIIEGVSVQCDTAEEAMQLARLNSNGATGGKTEHKNPSTTSTPLGSRWTQQRLRDFLDVINANQRKFIDALLDYPDGRTEDQMFPLVGVRNSMGLAGITSAL